MEFKHPKYYKELRKLRNNLDQAISSCSNSTELAQRSPGPGHKLDVPAPAGPSVKQQASSDKHQAASSKPQAKPEPSSGSSNI